MSKFHVGTSGYSYDDWAGRFYPKDVRREEWLSFYVTKFDTVELNVTFYRTPNQKTFVGWYEKTPKDFHFVVKGSRFITHLKRLKDVKDSIKIFFDAASPLESKLKVVLWQLPPKFPADNERLERFLQLLPRSVRQAFEFRDRSWLMNTVYDVLRKHNAALVFSDHPFDITQPATADFIYFRRHGPGALFASKYTNRQLARDAELIKKWAKDGKDVYTFFNNDVRGYAVENALELKELLI